MSALSKALSYRKTIRFAGIAGLLALLLPVMASKAQAQSALDGFDPNANDIIRVVVVQPDGKILLGGDFTSLAPNGGAPVARNRIARLNPDGTLDAAFNPDADQTVYSIAVQPDGKIVAGGFFILYRRAVAQLHIARLDAVTGLADSFDPNANDIVQAVAVQPNGKILAGWRFYHAVAQRRSARHAQPHRPAKSGRDPRYRLQPECEWYGLYNRAAGGWQDFGGRQFRGPNSIGGQAA